jgi:hypothetical protein
MVVDVAALRREQNDLRKRLDAIDRAIDADHESAPDAYEIERGPTVTVMVPLSDEFVLPTGDESRALAELAYSEYDFLQRCSDDAFERAFIAIGHMNRLDAPNRKISFSTHVENVGDVARQLGFIGTVPGNAVLTALICHNNVACLAEWTKRRRWSPEAWPNIRVSSASKNSSSIEVGAGTQSPS